MNNKITVLEVHTKYDSFLVSQSNNLSTCIFSGTKEDIQIAALTAYNLLNALNVKHTFSKRTIKQKVKEYTDNGVSYGVEESTFRAASKEEAIEKYLNSELTP